MELYFCKLNYCGNYTFDFCDFSGCSFGCSVCWGEIGMHELASRCTYICILWFENGKCDLTLYTFNPWIIFVL
jgi:hypothetical protein